MTTVFIPQERQPGERRVAATPETVKKMVGRGLAVVVEQGAGTAAYFFDADYRAAGAALAAEPAYDQADAVLKVAPPTAEEAARLKPGAVLIGFLAAHRNLAAVRQLADRGVTTLALELVPRVTRAQPMDALSSQANVAGYRAVLLAAGRLPKYFPLMMTAAGTVKPARVVVMGAGVAGLQAVATARRLGAVAEVSDIRQAVKEQVESLGAKFIELPLVESGEGAGGYAREMSADFLARQREIVKRHVAAADVVITTALVPGKRAPLLLTRDMVTAMKPGSVVVDLAISEGGNCELSKADEETVADGVTVLAPANLAAAVPHDASALYARNVLALLLEVVGPEGTLAIDFGNEIVDGATLTHGGEVRHAATAELLQGQVVAV